MLELVAAAIFILLRLYHLPTSLFFFNDWGRDMLVLQKWQLSGLPPLLGPLTSAIPFNQSAFYFYLLYPGFIVSHGQPIANVFTLILFSLIIFFFIKRKFKVSLPLLILLVAIHPQFIIQSRFVWNPSFVAPLIFLAYYAYQKKSIILFSTSIALAVSLSYSVAPLLIAFVAHWLIFNRKHPSKYLLFLSLSFAIFNLPTLLFELRHHFFLTQQLFTQAPASQGVNTLVDRFSTISSFLISFPFQTLNLVLFSLLLIFSLLHYKKTPFFLFLATAIVTLALPLRFHYQYIFPLLSLALIIITSLPKRFSLLIALLLSLIYLQPAQLNTYFQTPARTYSQMDSCYQSFCTQFTSPAFISTQANFHSFHNGPEHRYLLRKNGCQIKDIETENGTAEYMVVVQDGSQLTSDIHYYELDLFGPYQTQQVYQCQANLSLRLIQKSPTH